MKVKIFGPKIFKKKILGPKFFIIKILGQKSRRKNFKPSYLECRISGERKFWAKYFKPKILNTNNSGLKIEKSVIGPGPA